MGENYVIGVDGGTESLRAGVFDSKGTPLAIAAASYPTSFPQPSWAEQNPSDWWQVCKNNASLDARTASTQAMELPCNIK